MRIILINFLLFLTIQVYTQTKIVGRIVDYSSNKPCDVGTLEDSILFARLLVSIMKSI